MAQPDKAPRSALGKLREARVHFGLFDFALFCVIGPREDLYRYVTWRRGAGALSNTENADGLYFTGGGEYAPIIWMASVPKNPVEYGTLAHEVSHAIIEMMVSWAGMTINHETSETFCHSIDYAMRKIMLTMKGGGGE